MSARRLLLVGPLAAVFVACGLVSHDETLTPFPPDGVDDFGEATPVEVCLGTARVVAPAVAVGLGGSLCVPSDVPARDCADDATCDGIERCVCGRCIVEACTGSSCDADRVCRGNRCTTGCAHDADCRTGERCETGGCARICSGDGDCHHGERCDPLDGVCSTSLCSAGVPCGTGDVCEAEQVTSDLREPELATVDGAEIGFLQIVTPGAPPTSAILRVRVDGPNRWTADPEHPVLTSDPGEAVGAPAVIATGKHVVLFFAVAVGDGSAIARAVSEDGGRSFQRDAAPVLVPEEAWERGWVGSPAVTTFGGVILLAYEGGPRAGIGLARVDDKGGATRVSPRAAVTPRSVTDAVFWRDVTEVRSPYLAVAGSVLRIYFTGRGVEASDAIVGDASVPAPPNDSIGLAATNDLQSFDVFPAGPAFSRVTNLRAYLGEAEAAVLLAPGGTPGAAIVFVSADASGKQVTGLARAGTTF